MCVRAGADWGMDAQAHGPFPERAAAAVAYETLKVISICHSNSMVHGDIKPSNLMLLQVRLGVSCSMLVVLCLLALP